MNDVVVHDEAPIGFARRGLTLGGRCRPVNRLRHDLNHFPRPCRIRNVPVAIRRLLGARESLAYVLLLRAWITSQYLRDGNETTAYYADKLEDAVNTAVEMARKRTL